MKTRRTPLCCALVCGLLLPLTALAAQPQWRVVLHGSTDLIQVEDLPLAADGHSITTLGPDLGPQGALGFGLERDDGRDGRWIEHGGALVALAELGTSGTTGPGRGGAESAHVFRQWLGSADAGVDGENVFVARAGAPDATLSSALDAVWRSQGTSLSEIARHGRDDVLGPGLGAGWFFSGNEPFASATAAGAGRFVLRSSVRTDALSSRGAIVLHDNGSNSTCTMAFSTLPGHAPGLFPSDVFESLAQPAIDFGRGVFVRGTARTEPPGGGFRTGLWRVCDGAPDALVVSDETGARGPGLQTGTAVFSNLSERIAPADGGFFFAASGRASIAPEAAPFIGVFFHADGANRPVFLADAEGALGPGLPGMVFSNDSVLQHVRSGGRFGLVTTTVQPVGGGTTQTGLWRLQSDGTPRPMALTGDTGSLAPAPGIAWTRFLQASVFANGDVATLASTSNAQDGLWLLGTGQLPQLLLRVGDSVAVPIEGGEQRGTVTAISLPGDAGVDDYAGDDTWAGEDGRVLLQVRLSGFDTGEIWVRGRVTDPGRLLRDSFE